MSDPMELPDIDVSLTDQTPLADWCANIAWAVTTEADCYGWQWQPEWAREKYALYDANEDDPPIAVFEDRETAERVAEALIRVGRTARGRAVTDTSAVLRPSLHVGPVPGGSTSDRPAGVGKDPSLSPGVNGGPLHAHSFGYLNCSDRITWHG